MVVPCTTVNQKDVAAPKQRKPYYKPGCLSFRLRLHCRLTPRRTAIPVEEKRRRPAPKPVAKLASLSKTLSTLRAELSWLHRHTKVLEPKVWILMVGMSIHHSSSRACSTRCSLSGSQPQLQNTVSLIRRGLLQAWQWYLLAIETDCLSARSSGLRVLAYVTWPHRSLVPVTGLSGWLAPTCQVPHWSLGCAEGAMLGRARPQSSGARKPSSRLCPP